MSKQPVPFRVTLSIAVRQLRGSKNLSLRDLAERANISHELVSQIERGLANPAIDIVTNLAKALGVEVGVFAVLPKTDKSIVQRMEFTVGGNNGEDYMLAAAITYLIAAGIDTEIDQLCALANSQYALNYPWGVICEQVKNQRQE